MCRFGTKPRRPLFQNPGKKCLQHTFPLPTTPTISSQTTPFSLVSTDIWFSCTSLHISSYASRRVVHHIHHVDPGVVDLRDLLGTDRDPGTVESGHVRFGHIRSFRESCSIYAERDRKAETIVSNRNETSRDIDVQEPQW